MSEFLLLGVRPHRPGELELSKAAHDVVALAGWHQLLRHWGLLRSFAVPDEPVAGLRACLLIHATEHGAAATLAAGWSRLSGYEVTVLPLAGVSVAVRARP
jgi:hypothetical protein